MPSLWVCLRKKLVTPFLAFDILFHQTWVKSKEQPKMNFLLNLFCVFVIQILVAAAIPTVEIKKLSDHQIGCYYDFNNDR